MWMEIIAYGENKLFFHTYVHYFEGALEIKGKKVHSPVRRVPMTLMANLATLRDLGRAYWVHKYDSNWIAKICVEIYIHKGF